MDKNHKGYFLSQVSGGFQNMLLIVCFFFVFLGDKASACPGMIYHQDLQSSLPYPRNQTYLWTLTSDRNHSWRSIPMQIDPIDEDGRLVFFDDPLWMNDRLATHDRFVFSVDGFGRRLRKSDQAPCDGMIVYELEDRVQRGRYAYLGYCQNPMAEALVIQEESLGFDGKKRQLIGDEYLYVFNEDNHMLFDQVYLQVAKEKILAAESSDILIFSDIKNFFTFRFDSSNIESKLEKVNMGPLGANARVSFYLKILFFRFKLALSTDVSFYKDSAFIPMMIHIPEQADGRLNHGSGIVYSWQWPRSEGPIRSERTTMAKLNDKLFEQIKGDFPSIQSIGRKDCAGSTTCEYQHETVMGEKSFVMDFAIPQETVQKGFFPYYLEDLRNHPQFSKTSPSKNDPRRLGFFFPTSGLSSGNYSWDFWLRVGTLGDRKLCPHPLRIRKT